jgi:Asp-tRNA(Asn)/Glu-tRNA(Gln) amidotransferase A subunit family amidase
MSDSSEVFTGGEKDAFDRRHFLAYFSGIGLSSTLLPGVLWAKLQDARSPKVTKDVLREAERIAGLELTEAERDSILEGVNRQVDGYERLRAVSLPNSVAPAIQFSPIVPGMTFDKRRRPFRLGIAPVPAAPTKPEDAAFWPVTQLARLIRARQISSVELTKMYLERLKKYDPKLRCVITLTEEMALQQAKRADQELAAGRYRGPLHGIPWGAKDLLATRGTKTTWGALPYKDQVIDEDATVVQRLEKAGAVLVAKLTLGALAQGDLWYAGRTRNPWNPEQGSSGSSAGPAAATVAGLVGFSIGTETLGSIVSPCTRCGATGLRPTFGRVSRYGAMALSWSMDKIGPLCRTAEDCAVVFNAIYGPDGKDSTVVDFPFNWNPALDVTRLRVGYLKGAFEQDRPDKEWAANDHATLEKLRSLGIKLVPIELPEYPVQSLRLILNAESAAAFDELTRRKRDDPLVQEGRSNWPTSFRQSRFIPAVEYIQANRVRALLMEAMAKLMATIDVYVAPSTVGNNLLLTNLTGHPTVVLPNGFTQRGAPTSISFIGKLYGEADVLALAKAYQAATDFHLKHPAL